MKIKRKVTTASASLLQLVLLSSITLVEFYHLNEHSKGIPNKMMRSSMENCADYKDIRKWFELQDAAVNSLQRHYDQMEKALGTKASTNCCFYDKDLMQSVMDNVNQIDQQNGLNGRKTVSPSGELRHDLNNIIPRIKKLVTTGFKSCCSNKEESLKKIKKDFKEQLVNVKEKFKSDEFSKDMKDLEEMHQSLKYKIKDINEEFAKLESKTMRSDYQTSCCAELNTKTKALENQIEAVENENDEKINQFENQLKDFENMLRDVKNRNNGVKNSLESQGEAVEELESCENYNFNCCEPCLDKLVDRLKELEEQIKSLIDKVNSQAGNHKDINNCLENDKRLDKIKDHLFDQSKILKPDNNSDQSKILNPANNSLPQIISALANENLKELNKKLENEIKGLQQAASESEVCCTNVGKLNASAVQLQNKIEEMEQIKADIIQQNNNNNKELKNQLKDNLSKLDDIQKNKDNIKNKEKELEKLKNLLPMLEKVKSDLKVQEGDVNELFNQDHNNNNDNNETAVDILNKTVTESEHIWGEVDQELLKHPNNRLSMLSTDLITNVKPSLEGLQQKENEYLMPNKNLEDQVSKCAEGCKAVEKMHENLKILDDVNKKIYPNTK